MTSGRCPDLRDPQRRHRHRVDQLVARLPLPLGLTEQLLVQLLPVPQPGEHDLDVGPPAHLDHLLGHVEDPHRLAHVEHHRLPVPAHRGGLDHQLAGLGDHHEEAGHVGVGDRHGAAVGDLVGERRQHRAARAQHVAEPHRHELARRLARHAGGQPLSDPLGVAQHAGRVGGLVGGDVDEHLHAVLARCLQHVGGAQHVGLPRLLRVLLEHRQVLERRGVEHHLRAVLVEDRAPGPRGRGCRPGSRSRCRAGRGRRCSAAGCAARTRHGRASAAPPGRS